MKRDPAQIVHMLTEQLRQMDEGEEASINELASRAELHWTTVDRYLSLLQFVHGYVPRIEIMQAGRSKAVRITQNAASATRPPIQRMLLRLYRSRAVTPESAIQSTKDEAEAALELEKEGFVKVEADAKIRLTRIGLLKAAEAFGRVSRDFDERIQPSFDADEAEAPVGSTSEMLQEISARQAKLEVLFRQILERGDVDMVIGSRLPARPRVRPWGGHAELPSDFSASPDRRKREFALESPLPNSA